MTELILIRHGETDWNLEGRWQGQADVPLNANGLAQATRLAGEMKPFFPLDAIYASDLTRARQTADPLAAAVGLPIIFDIRLREIHQGEWQGLKVTEIRQRYGQQFDRRHADPWLVAPPGGETAQEVGQRVSAALSAVQARYPQGRVAVVSHGFVLAVAQVLCHHLPVADIWDLIPENCVPLVIHCDQSSARITEGR